MIKCAPLVFKTRELLVRVPFQFRRASFHMGGFDENDIAEILEVLGTNGGHCDCEILFNVAENSRLKSEYWRARAEGRLLPQPHRK